MKVIVFGATGGTGTCLVRESLARGHEVTAMVRNPAGLDVPPQQALTVVSADIMNPDLIAPHLDGVDIVFSALGSREINRPTTLCRDALRSIISAMQTTDCRRLLVVSASGLAAEGEDDWPTRWLAKPIVQRVLRHHFADLAAMESCVQASQLDWTIVRPPRLLDKPARGHYRQAVDRGLKGGYSIPRADLATSLLALSSDSGSIGHVVTVAS